MKIEENLKVERLQLSGVVALFDESQLWLLSVPHLRLKLVGITAGLGIHPPNRLGSVRRFLSTSLGGALPVRASRK